MAILFLLAALASLFAWHFVLEKRGRAHLKQKADASAVAPADDQTFVSDVAWLVFCAPIAVGLMLIGAAGLTAWSMSGGPACSRCLLWPWCGLIVLIVCYHGWSRKRGS